MKDIIFDPSTPFSFKSGDYVPFKDREVCERVRLLTREQLEIVQSGNCDHVQGFFFDRPMPVEEFEKRMEGTNYGELMA